MADDKKSDLDKFGVRGMLDKAGQGALAPPRNIVDSNEFKGVWGKDKAKYFKDAKFPEVVSDQQARTGQSDASIHGDLDNDFEQRARLKSLSPEAFAGDELDYTQLEVLIDKHPRRTIVEVYRRFVIQPTFATFLMKVFAEGGWRFLRIKFADKIKLGKNDQYLPLDEPANGPAYGEPVPLEGLDDQIVIDYVARSATADPKFASRLQAAFAEAKRPAVELPTVAPKLWTNRTDDDPSNPSAFIRQVYAEWLPHTLARQDLQHLDRALYLAYAGWVKPTRHPDDTVDFAPKRPPPNKLDDAEFAIRARAANAVSSAKARATHRERKPR